MPAHDAEPRDAPGTAERASSADGSLALVRGSAPPTRCLCAALANRRGPDAHVLETSQRSGRSELEAAIERWSLTAREAEVVALVADGEANKDVAQRLGVAPRTIEVHVGAVLRKANVESRARLIAHFWTRR